MENLEPNDLLEFNERKSPSWREIVSNGPKPDPRSGAASVVVDNKLYIFGGYGGHGRLGDFVCYDFIKRTWKIIPNRGDIPGRRENNGMVCRGNCLYLFGGYNGENWLNDFHEFNLETQTWHKLEPKEDEHPAPVPRFGYVSAVWSDYFVVWGGYNGSTWLSDMSIYNFTTKKWTAVEAKGVRPSVRSCPSWTQYEKSIYMFGGYNGSTRLNDFFEFNVSTLTWTRLATTGPAPSPRYFHASAVYDGMMYVFLMNFKFVLVRNFVPNDFFNKKKLFFHNTCIHLVDIMGQVD